MTDGGTASHGTTDSHRSHADGRTDRGTLVVKFGLAVGFFVLAGGVWAAYRTPATGYELSIYAATPAAFWGAVVVAAFLSVLLAFYPSSPRWLRAMAAVLGGCTATVLFSLPVLRGYYFFGAGDSMTHLGWVTDMAAGRLDPWTFMYPATHLLTVVLGEGAGITPRRAILLMVVGYAVVSLVFVPLCLLQFTDRKYAVSVGVFSAALLLPVNNVSVHLMSHPTTQAILFAPFVLYALFRYLRRPVGDEPLRRRVSPWGVVVVVGTFGFVFVHPQQGVSLLLLFVTIAGLQALARWRGVDGQIVAHNPVFVQSLLFGGLMAFWLPRHVRATGAFDAIVGQFVSGEGDAGGLVSHQSSSLTQVGGSIEELFLKLFAVPAFYALLAAIVGLLALRHWRSPTSDGEAFVQYLAVAAVPLGAQFTVYFLSGVTRQHYRQIGFIVMLVTILGAVGIVYGVSFLRRRLPAGSVSAGVGLVLFVSLLVSIPVVYASPYIYQPSQHVTEAEFDGFAFSFEHGADHAYVGVRAGPDRQVDAIYGTVGSADGTAPLVGDGVPPEVFNSGNYTAYYDDPRYFVVTRDGYERESYLWKGFRYTEDGFAGVGTRPGVDQVYSNGDIQTYLVGGNESTASDAGQSSQATSVANWHRSTEGGLPEP